MAPRRAVFVGHDIYREAAYGRLHPLAIARVESVVDLCRALGWLADGEYQASPRATDDELAAFHDREYVAALREASSSGRVDAAVRERHNIGTMENPIFPGVFERASTSVGGSIHAARLALEGRIAYHPAGGTHHGRPGRASGFCFFNDPVFALLTLLEAGVGRVAYVDLDAHHCDAVQDAFAADARVRMVSIHEAGRWPHTGAFEDRAGGHALNLPVPPGFNDAELAFLMDELVLPFAAAFRPQALVVACGADALEGDPLARMALSNGALWDAVDSLVAIAPATVVLGGGGYNPWTLARYWTGLWGRLSGRAIPLQLPDAARAVLASLACDLVDDEDLRPEWLSTLADARVGGPVRPAIHAMHRAARARVAEGAPG
jgi:acetoin utilization protein AcuC